MRGPEALTPIPFTDSLRNRLNNPNYEHVQLDPLYSERLKENVLFLSSGNAVVRAQNPDYNTIGLGFFAGPSLPFGTTVESNSLVLYLTAITTCNIVRIPPEDITKNPDEWILAETAKALRVRQKTLGSISLGTAEQRIAMILLQLASFSPNGVIELSQEDISRIAGLTTPTVSKQFVSFKKRGLIGTEEYPYHKTILNKEELERIANEV